MRTFLALTSLGGYQRQKLACKSQTTSFMPEKKKKHMKSQLNLSLHKKHLFADTAEGHALIDTGAPFTASRTGKLAWGGSTRMVREGGYLGFNFDTLSANIGTQVDALVGLDLLTEQSMRFDLVTGSLELGVATPAEGSFDIDTSGLMGIPAVNISVNGLMAKGDL